jgi:hypothetical protein
MEGMPVYKVDGSPVEVQLSGVRGVADLRHSLAVALGVDTQPHVGIKILNGPCDVSNDTPLGSLDMDAGLCVILVQGAPEWYPREKYMHDEKEVLQLAGERGGEFFAEFLDGSSEAVDEGVYDNALRHWAWTEVAKDGRVWAHPSEKPLESGGWSSFFTRPKVQKTAAQGAGVFLGFISGVSGNCTDLAHGGGDFSNAFNIAQIVGVSIYCIFQVVRLFRK